MPKMNEAQRKALDSAEKMMLNSEKLHKSGHRLESITMLKKALKNFTAVTKGNKIDNVPQSMYKLQARMATELGKWEAELKVHEIKRAEQSKKQTKSYIENKGNIKKVVKDFVSAMQKHSGDKSVKSLIAGLTELSKKFDHDKDLKAFKSSCKMMMDEHKSKHLKMHHRQPSGVFQHIVNALRAMMRLLEKMFNYVTGCKSSMFKKPDSEFGKSAKEFTQKVMELKEFEEPAPKVVHKHG